MSRKLGVVALAGLALGCGMVTSAIAPIATVEAKKKPIATRVEVAAKSSARLGFNPEAGGGMYRGVVRFTKVSSVFSNRRVTKQLATRARGACQREYSKGGSGKLKPGVRLLQLPLQYGGLRLNDASVTKFQRGGSWEQYGAAPVKFEPYVGKKILAQGGFWDEQLNNRSGKSVKFNLGKQRISAYCETFTTVINPG